METWEWGKGASLLITIKEPINNTDKDHHLSMLGRPVFPKSPSLSESNKTLLHKEIRDLLLHKRWMNPKNKSSPFNISFIPKEAFHPDNPRKLHGWLGNHWVALCCALCPVSGFVCTHWAAAFGWCWDPSHVAVWTWMRRTRPWAGLRPPPLPSGPSVSSPLAGRYFCCHWLHSVHDCDLDVAVAVAAAAAAAGFAAVSCCCQDLALASSSSCTGSRTHCKATAIKCKKIA